MKVIETYIVIYGGEFVKMHMCMNNIGGLVYFIEYISGKYYEISADFALSCIDNINNK